MASQSQTGIIEVGTGAYAFIQAEGATNGGFIVGEEGVIIVEALMTKALTEHVKAEVKKVTSLPIRSVIATHFHGDHTFGNQYYLPASILGHGTSPLSVSPAGTTAPIRPRRRSSVTPG